MPRRLAALAAAVWLVGACSATDLTLGAPEVTSTTTTTVRVSTTTGPPATAAPTTTSAGPTVPGAALFVDPAGRYVVEVAPEWPTQDVDVPGVTAWIVGEPVDGFTPNMNVLTQGGLRSVSLERFLAESARGPEQFLDDPEIIDQSVVEGPYGSLGRLEYRGTQEGLVLRFVQLIALSDGTAAVVTFSVPDAVAGELVPRFERYMRTVRLR